MKIPGIVIFVHVLILACFLFFQQTKPKLKPRKPVAVQTYIVQEEKPKTPVKPAESKPVAPKPKPVENPKPKPKSRAIEKPKPATHAKTDGKHEKLVRMMQQSLASLNHVPAESKQAEVKQIGTLASEALTFETTYQDRLIAFLQNALTLPEKGDVKISLTLNRMGGVNAVIVKHTASERNQQYVEETIPTLLLPSFDDHFKGENTHMFSITLTSL